MTVPELGLLHTIRDISQDKGGVPITVIKLLEALARKNLSLEIQLAASPGKSPLLNKGAQVSSNLSWRAIPEEDNYAFRKVVQGIIQEQQRQFKWVIHDHGIWLPCNHAVAIASRRLGIPRVVTTHGMLEPWAWQYKAWKKQIAWWLFQYRDLQTAQVLHATAEREALNLRRFFPNLPVALISPGTDLPPRYQIEHSNPNKSPKTLLFLSRIHQVKGLLNLVNAWAHLQDKDWQLIIAGPDEGGYRAVVEKRVQELRLNKAVSFYGEVVGEAKWKLYQSADLFVLPTLSENFGMVIAEALACATPVITTKEAPWSDLETYRCGWWINTGVAPLIEALQQAMSLNDAERTAMGQRGRMLVESKYTWQRTATKMLALYHWVAGQGSKPASLLD